MATVRCARRSSFNVAPDVYAQNVRRYLVDCYQVMWTSIGFPLRTPTTESNDDDDDGSKAFCNIKVLRFLMDAIKVEHFGMKIADRWSVLRCWCFLREIAYGCRIKMTLVIGSNLLFPEPDNESFWYWWHHSSLSIELAWKRVWKVSERLRYQHFDLKNWFSPPLISFEVYLVL